MSQNNNIHDPLEQFFKKNLEDYDIDYNEEDWKDLKGRLDHLDHQQAAIPLSTVAAAAAVFLFALLGYFTHNNHLELSKVEQQLNEHSLLSQDSAPGTITNQNDSGKPSTSPEKSDESQQSSNRSPSSSTTKGASPVKETGKNEFITAADSIPISFVTDLPTADLQNTGLDKRETETTVGSLIPAKQIPIQPESGQSLNGHRESSDFASPPSDANTASRHSQAHFSLSLTMAPDLSAAGSLADFHSPGFKIGLQAEYNVNRSLGISAGILHSTIHYTAGSGDYQPPVGYWTNGRMPQKTLAECVIIDIPVKLKYNFKNWRQSRLYATAGLSTYIMVNEDYRFNYDFEGYNLAQGWSNRTGTLHWLSTAGISVGYEKDINERFSLRMEPFLNIPLQEVGWGNVRLYSIGSFFTINYKL